MPTVSHLGTLIYAVLSLELRLKEVPLPRNCWSPWQRERKFRRVSGPSRCDARHFHSHSSAIRRSHGPSTPGQVECSPPQPRRQSMAGAHWAAPDLVGLGRDGRPAASLLPGQQDCGCRSSPPFQTRHAQSETQHASCLCPVPPKAPPAPGSPFAGSFGRPCTRTPASPASDPCSPASYHSCHGSPFLTDTKSYPRSQSDLSKIEIC